MRPTPFSIAHLVRITRRGLSAVALIAATLTCLAAGAKAQSWDYSQSSRALTDLPAPISAAIGHLPAAATDSQAICTSRPSSQNSWAKAI